MPPTYLDLDTSIDTLTKGQIDFNDAILIDICKNQNLKLMTNDTDFQYGGITVLTANLKLLQMSNPTPCVVKP